jgi:hypothetical protein
MKAEIDIAKLWIDKCQAYLRPECNKLALGGFLQVEDIKVHRIRLSSICIIVYSCRILT